MIGVFDSGVGGLTVVKALRTELPFHDIVYFGDTARTPYGNKSKETIKRYALEDADFLIKKGANMIVIACNTASSVAYDDLKLKYPNIPIFEVITPAVLEAVRLAKHKRIGVIGTRATINSQIYKDKLEEMSAIVKSQECPLFVPFIEEGWLDKIELKMIVRRYLSDLKNFNLDVLILGCTHYPIIKNIIQQKIGKKIILIDSASVIAKDVKKYLDKSLDKFEKNGKVKIYFSDLTKQVKKITHSLVGVDVVIEQCNNLTI